VDTIIIADLEVNYRVGVPEAERKKPQRLLLSIDLAVDFRRAATMDRLGETIDYDSVCRRLLQFGDGREWQLIETLSVEIAEALLAEYSAQRVTVEVKKFVIPQARHVAVRTTRPID
jgi:7,8-dihydroneopterin aldolase/epimerase/oxygenase